MSTSKVGSRNLIQQLLELHNRIDKGHPPAPDGWQPFSLSKEGVMARRTDGNVSVTQIFAPTGVWKEIYDYLVAETKFRVLFTQATDEEWAEYNRLKRHS
jgi:hypothetical protein